MKEKDLFSGFSEKKQAEYEQQIIERFGEAGKARIEESKKNAKELNPEKIKAEFDEICRDLVQVLNRDPKDREVQKIVRKHYLWLSQFWKPNRETYAAHAQFILESDLRKAYEAYDLRLPEFLALAIQIFAKEEL
jgi:hypothetical protein